MSNKSEAIRLTNKTARALREQAKQQRTALYAFATVLSILLAGAAVIIGIEHLIAVPVMVLIAIVLDALIILLARGRYLSLTGQAICTEAAARQLRGQSAEEARVSTAKRDLERIKADLAMREREDEEDDEDMYAPAAHKAAKPQPVRLREEDGEKQDTRVIPAAQRRRRQARLQVITGDAPDNQAN